MNEREVQKLFAQSRQYFLDCEVEGQYAGNGHYVVAAALLKIAEEVHALHRVLDRIQKSVSSISSSVHPENPYR
jgi:hypothetical protein